MIDLLSAFGERSLHDFLVLSCL